MADSPPAPPAGSQSAPPVAEKDEELSPQEVIARYKQMRDEVRRMAEKITELELEYNEHQLVISTITPMEKGRKAFRMVGSVLVQNTVGDVLPHVENHANMLKQLMTNLEAQLKAKEQESNAWKTKYNIMTQQEREMMMAAQQKQQASA